MLTIWDRAANHRDRKYRETEEGFKIKQEASHKNS